MQETQLNGTEKKVILACNYQPRKIEEIQQMNGLRYSKTYALLRDLSAWGFLKKFKTPSKVTLFKSTPLGIATVKEQLSEPEQGGEDAQGRNEAKQ